MRVSNYNGVARESVGGAANRVSSGAANRGASVFVPAIDHGSGIKLVDQITSGFREAIAVGRIPVGTAVPSLRSLAESLDVSLKTTRAAYSRLERTGWLCKRAGIGCTAKTPDLPQRKGSALVVLDKVGYYTLALGAQIQMRLEDAGYSVTNVVMRRDGSWRPNIASLDIALTRTYDFIVASGGVGDVARERISKSGLPYVIVTYLPSKWRGAKGCLGVVVNDSSKAAAGLVAACRRARVKTVWSVDFDDVSNSFSAALRKAGFAVKPVTVVRKAEFPINGWSISSVVRTAAYDAFREMLPRCKLPDAIYFADDHVALGALAAMDHAGISIPRDVRVVLFENVGECIPRERPYTRISSDPFRHGDMIAKYVLGRYQGDLKEKVLRKGPEFVPGDTL